MECGCHCRPLGRAEQVVRELKKEELQFESEAESDGEVIVILDLTDDPSLAAEGIARELVNRVQQMRKHARLPVGFPVDVFYNIIGTPEANFPETFAAALDEKAAYLEEVSARLSPSLGLCDKGQGGEGLCRESG